MRDRVTVLAPAKLNLALDVVGILPGGYHALDMTMQAISLYERVVIRRSPYLDLTLPGSNVKPGPGNTAIKAALAFFHYTGLLAGADITIYKNVPVRAGMAGGSADAAAVLVGLNELYGARLSMSELCALGAGIGADVPFALMGGTCRVQGLGDLIKALPPMPECWFTVVMPDYGVSTPEAFAAYDKVGSSVHPDCAAQEAAIRAGDLDAVCAAAGNALEECSGAKDNEAIKAALRENGAVTALMTGSGAAVFGVFRTEAEAKAAADALRARWPQVYTAQPVREGRRCRYCGRDEASPSYNLSVGLAPASSPCRGASGEEIKFPAMPRPPLDRSNNDDRRQWRKQGVAVGAAASKTQAKRCGCWVPQPGQWHCEAMTERLFL